MVDVIKSKDANCEDCGIFNHLMPYGPGGTYVCFDCAMKDKKGTEERFHKLIDNKDMILDHRNKTEH